MTTQMIDTLQQNLQAQLNKHIANDMVLYTKLHNYHWYIKGGHFFTLHAKFEELYNETTDTMDLIAERLLAIGGKPIAKLSDALAMASISEAQGNETAEEMVASLIQDYTVIISELKDAMDTAHTAGDEATSDLLLGVQASLDKHVWMLNAFLGK